MARRLRVSPQANADLDEIEIWSKREYGPGAANRLLARMRALMRALPEEPFVGSLRPEFGPGVRFVRVRPYVVYFDVNETEVRILRILHERRDRDDIMDG